MPYENIKYDFLRPQFTSAIDNDGHGTKCALVACGKEFVRYNQQRRQVKFRGVVPKANLTVCKAYENRDSCHFNQIIKALKLISEREITPDVVVLASGQEEPDDTLENVVQDLVKNVLIVCATSNDGAITSNNILYPVLYKETISIGSCDAGGKSSSCSPKNNEMEFLALGEPYLLYNGEMVQEMGTSFAAPAVGALICLLLQAVRDNRPGRNDDMFAICHKTTVMKKILEYLTDNTQRDKDGFGTIKANKVSHFIRDPQHYIEKLKEDNIIKK